MWKAKIINISAVDIYGSIEVVFDLLLDGNVMYTKIYARGNVDDIIKVITSICSKIITGISKSKELSVGQEIEIVGV